MNKEFEVKILEINKDEIIKKLESLGATKIKDVLMKRKIFNDTTGKMDKEKEWVRLRDNGDGKIKIAYKCYHDFGDENNIPDCDEIEFEVSDFEKPEHFLLALGFEKELYQENRRTRYKLDNIIFDIDQWPLIPCYLEIESESEKLVKKGLSMLGFNMSDTFPGNTAKVFEKYGYNIHIIKELKFK